MPEKKFKLNPEEIKELIKGHSGCVATDNITVDGLQVGFMYRERPDEDIEADSGWRFLSGTEEQDYVDDEDNSEIFALNVIANYDPSVIPYLQFPIGTELERVKGKNEFQQLE